MVVERLKLTTFFVVAEWKPICMNPSFSEFDVHSVGITGRFFFFFFFFCTKTSPDRLNS